MLKKYCVLDSQNKFINSYETLDEDSKIKFNVIYEIPPKVTSGTIAFWQNGSWKVRRKKPSDDIDHVLYEKAKDMQYEKLENRVRSRFTFAVQKKGRRITHKEMINFLEIELNRYLKTIVDLSFNKQKVPKIFKTYAKELQDTIELIKSKSNNKNNTLTSFSYNLNETVFDLTEILENKVEADTTLEELQKII